MIFQEHSQGRLGLVAPGLVIIPNLLVYILIIIVRISVNRARKYYLFYFINHTDISNSNSGL